MRQFENLKMKGLGILLTTALFACNGKDEKPVAPAEKQVGQTTYNEVSCDTDFDVFFKKFRSDSVFQKKHVRFPLKNTFLDSEGMYEVIRQDVTPAKYKFLDFTGDEEAAHMENGAFTIKIEKQKDSVFYLARGIDNGIHTDIKFAFINGCWYLVAIEDAST